MRLIYENKKQAFEILERKSRHVPPHIHSSVECIYITEGSLELGIDYELYHMEKGSFGIVFPDLIHHYQVFDSSSCRAIHLIASTANSNYSQLFIDKCPIVPVIPSQKVHPDIPYALKTLLKEPHTEQDYILQQAYSQIIFARSLPLYEYMKKSDCGSDDIIYQTVTYIAKHFNESITLTQMAHDLGRSPYALSRVFSKTFHRNFNQYVNGLRLEYAVSRLLHTKENITDICMNAGFDSQRTFNRVFKEKYHISPRDFRKEFHEGPDSSLE